MPPSSPTAKRRTIRTDAAFRPLLLAFLNDTRTDVAALNDALEYDDADTVRAKGHSLKGAGSGYGLETVTELGRAMEQAAANGDMESARRAVEALAAYLDEVDVVVAD